jgi:hypothetical protein
MHLPHIVLCGLAFLAGCTGQSKVEPVTAAIPAGVTTTAGRYAAQIQTGGWALAVDTGSWDCGAWTFDVDVNKVYADAMKDALKRSFESVEFIEETLKPEEMAQRGYDAEVVVYQGNVASKFWVEKSFFSAKGVGVITLTATMAILDRNGLKSQKTIDGHGMGREGIIWCGDISDVFGPAAEDAVRHLVSEVVQQVHDGLKPVNSTPEEKPAGS